MTLTGLGSNTPMFSFKGKADSSSPTSRRLLKGSFGGGGGGTSSGSFGRGVSSGRATGVTRYKTGSGSKRSVSYRSCVTPCLRRRVVDSSFARCDA